MGVSRLLAKGWGVFCLFAGLYALMRAALAPSGLTPGLGQLVVLIVVLFGAMGMLFIVGYGAAAAQGKLAVWLRLDLFSPGFSELVYLAFALMSFLVQTRWLPIPYEANPLDSVLKAMAFAVPGLGRLGVGLASCGVDGGRIAAAAFAWLLAFIYLGSSLSRLRLAAGIVRLERKQHPEPLTPTGTALLLGTVAVVLIQLLYVGTLYPMLPCDIWRGIGGDLLTGQAPLMLAYLITAALTHLLAMGPDA